MYKDNFFLTIVIPVFNGALQLPRTFLALDRFFDEVNGTVRVVFVDDGSDDKTRDLLDDYCSNSNGLAFFISNSSNLGKGKSIKKGFLEYCDSSKYIGFTDVDLPYGLDPVIEVMELMKKKSADVLIGNRSLVPDCKQYSAYRRLANKLFRLFIPKLVRDIEDTQSGFKFFRSFVAKQCFSRVITHRWVFDLEVLLIAKKFGYVIVQFPVKLLVEAKGAGGLSIIRDGFNILKDLHTIVRCEKKGMYDPT